MRFCVFALIAVFFISCSTTVPSLTTRSSPAMKMEASMIDLQIKDQRENVVQGNMAIPFSPFPGQNETRELVISDSLSAQIAKRIGSCITGSGKKILLDLEIVKARQGWSAGVAKKKELAEVKLAVIAMLEETREILFVSYPHAFSSVSTGKISTASLQALFEKTMLDALDKFLLNEAEIRILNNNLEKAQGMVLPEPDSAKAVPPAPSPVLDAAKALVPPADSTSAAAPAQKKQAEIEPAKTDSTVEKQKPVKSGKKKAKAATAQ